MKITRIPLSYTEDKRQYFKIPILPTLIYTLQCLCNNRMFSKNDAKALKKIKRIRKKSEVIQ